MANCHACRRYGHQPCGATTRDGYACTRHAGHQHDHVACVDDAHGVRQWSPVEQQFQLDAGVEAAETLIRRAAALIKHATGRDVEADLLAHVYCDECGELLDEHDTDCSDCPPAEVDGDESFARGAA